MSYYVYYTLLYYTLLYNITILYNTNLCMLFVCMYVCMIAHMYVYVYMYIFFWLYITHRLLVRKRSMRAETAIKHANLFPKLVMYTTLLPLLVIMSYRVIDRNTEWRDEFSIYSSALKVCPNNYKALTNTGMLLLNQNKGTNAAEAALLSDR